MVGGPLTFPPVPTVIVEAECSAPAQRVFDYVADYRNATDWLYGVKVFTPRSEETRALGSEFFVMTAGGFAIKTVVVCTELVEGEVFGLTSIKGFSISSRWRFRPVDAGTTHVVGEFTYTLPGGAAVRMAAKLAQPAITFAANRTAQALATNVAV